MPVRGALPVLLAAGVTLAIALVAPVDVIFGPVLAPAGATVPVVVVDGKGFGHGVGMAQDGALEMGRRGFGLAQILGQFYPGTSFAHLAGDVRVPVLGAGSAPTSAIVTFPDGGQVLDARSGAQSPGFPVAVPAGGAVTMGWDGTRYTVSVTGAGSAGAGSPGSGRVTTAGAAEGFLPPPPSTPPHTLLPLPPPPTSPPTTAPRRTTTTTTTTPRPRPPSPGGAPGGGTSPAPAAAPSSGRPLWAVPSGGGALGVPGRGRSYRGAIEAEGLSGALRLVNQVNVETYLSGMGEVINPSWPPASLEAQEVAARTYALRAMAASGELCDDTRCQVYLGTAGEYPAGQRAVAATAGLVLASGGSLVDAVYSANGAGFSASRAEGFGVADNGYPYLRAAPYPTGNPLPWTVTFSASDVAGRLGLRGALTDVAVTAKGPSGRALAVTLRSGQTALTVSGLNFAAALGLRSTMIDTRVAVADTPPPPPPTRSVIQVPPDQAGALALAPPPPASFSPAPSVTAPLALAPAPLTVRGRRTGSDLPIGPVAVAGLLLLLTAGSAVRLRVVTRRP